MKLQFFVAREFLVEPNIRSTRTVKEFKIAEKRRVWKDVLDELGFSPAAMANDDVGADALLLQLDKDPANSLAVENAVFNGRQIGMNIGCYLAVGLVGNQLDFGNSVLCRLGDEDDAIERRQFAAKMQELSGKVLVNEDKRLVLDHRPEWASLPPLD